MRTVHGFKSKVNVGDRFERLEVIGHPFRIGRRVYAVCRCDCGNVICSRTDGFGRKVLSCGCLMKEHSATLAGRTLVTHGRSKHPTYNILRAMISRCTNPKQKSWKDYGGRGISVCDEWRNDAGAFVEWSIQNGYAAGLQIDRINNDGNYEPTNCRWVTGSRNLRNQRRSRVVVAFGEKKCVADWADDPRCVVTRADIFNRLKHGWNPEDAISRQKRLVK